MTPSGQYLPLRHAGPVEECYVSLVNEVVLVPEYNDQQGTNAIAGDEWIEALLIYNLCTLMRIGCRF